MKKKTILNIVLALIGLAASLLLAIGGSSIEDNLHVRTPGMIALKVLVHPKPSPHEFEAVGQGLRLQMFVDWLFWFGLMWVLYRVTTKLSHRSQKAE
jgi:hypothetical protein